MRKEAPGPDDIGPSARTYLELIDRALAALAHQPQLVTRGPELEKLRPSPAAAALSVGLLGITSSGKSALLNAVMGTKWLPEDPLPTTRVPVVCSYGPAEAARVYFASDADSAPIPPFELDAEALAAGHLAALCDERARTAAARDSDSGAITGIELTSPYAELLRDSGTVLIDTPGLDAEGHNQHHLIAMNEVLPTLDLVIYLKPVSAPFKAADLALLNAMVGHDQPVLMLLTKSDTVHEQLESTPWGGLTIRKSAPQLIWEATRAAEAVLAHYPRLQRAGVLPVSALLAKQARLPSGQPSPADPGIAERRAQSGIASLETFLRALRTYKPALKAQRMGHHLARLLGRIAEDLADPSVEPSREESALPDNRELEIRALTAVHAEVAAELQAAEQRWRGEKSPLDRFVKRAESTLTETTVGQFDSELEQLFRDAIGEAAALRDKVQQRLDRFGLSLPRGGDADPPARQTEPPSTYESSVKGSWSWENPIKDFFRRFKMASGLRELLAAPFGWRRSADRTELNTLQMIRDIRSDVERLGRYLDAKRAELVQGGLHKLHNQIEVERSARLGAQDLLAGEPVPGNSRERAHRVLLRLQQQATDLLAATPHNLPAVPPLPPPPDLASQIPPTAPAALLGLVCSYGEQSLQREFLSIVGRLTKNRQPKVLLLGSDRRPLLELVARLLHRSQLQDTLAGVPADHWIRLEHKAQPAPVPVGARTWDSRQLGISGGTILDHLTLVVAPEDQHLTPLSADFLRRFDVVGVHIDAAQMGSGLADLARAGRRYVDALHGGAVPAFLVNGQGSTLEHVLDDLLLTIPAAVVERFPRFTSWFVYSDYDARYSRFLTLGQQALGEDLELVTLWEQHQLSFAPPFSPQRLRQVIGQAKSRYQAAGPQRTESLDEPR